MKKAMPIGVDNFEKHDVTFKILEGNIMNVNIIDGKLER